MRGCVWVGEIFSRHDKWQIKKKKCNHKIRVQEHNGGGAMSHQWHHVTSCDIIGTIAGVGCVIQGGSVMESYQFEILDQYFSVIVTIPHISIKSQSLCIPTYFSVYLKPQEVIIMHKIHKYLKTFLSSRRRRPSSWHHTIMAGTQSNFQIWQAYNIRGRWDGTRSCHRPGPMMAPLSQPHSLTATLTCIPTYFSVYLKPQEVIIMHKIHKYLKTFLSSRRQRPSSWCHMIMASTQSNFWLWQAYNIQGWRHGTRHPPSAPAPWWPPVTAPQPHSNSHFVYI